MKINKKILIIAGLIMFGMGVNAAQINVEKLNFELGAKSLKDNDLDDAIKYFKLVLDKNPKNVEAHYNLAVTYKKLGENEKAVEHFNKVVQLLNSPQEAEPALLSIAKQRQESSENYDVYAQVKAKENDYIDLGDMHADNGQNKEAIEFYNLALQVNPYNADTYFKVCKCYVELKDYNNAYPYINRAIELEKDNSRYNYYYDLVSKKADSSNKIVLQNFNGVDPLKEYEDKYYKKELYNDTSSKQIAEKGQIEHYYENKGNKDFLDKISSQDNENAINKPSQELDYLDLADLYYDNQDYETAIDNYNKALKVNSGNDYTYYKLSRCYLEIGDYQQADKYIEKALSMSGKNDKYAYFKNNIDRRIQGKPFAEEPKMQESKLAEGEYPARPTEQGPHYRQPEVAISDRIKNKIPNVNMPNVSLKMPEINLPWGNKDEETIKEKQEAIEKTKKQLSPDEITFNKDIKRYQIKQKTEEIGMQLGEPSTERTPYQVDTYNQKGVDFFNANNLEKAEEYFNKVLQINPTDARAYNNLANVEFKRGNMVKAAEYALQSVTLDPRFAPGYYNLSLINKKQRNFDSEISYLNLTVQADPKYYQAYFARGLAYYNRGNNEKAKADFSTVLEYKSDHYLASQNLGIIYANELNYPQAEKYLNQAARLNQSNPQTFYYLGFVEQNLGKIIESIENFEQSLELNPSNYKTYISLSKSYDMDGRPEKALETLQTATQQAPENAEIYNYLGLMNLKFKKYQEATAAFQQAATKNPNRSMYFYNLSQSYLCMGKRKESNDTFQKAVSVIPVTIQDYIDLSEIFFDRGMTSYAIQSLKEGITQLPESDYLYLVLSDFYERTGAKTSAKEILQEYLNKKTTQESAFSLLVRKRLNELENG